MSCKECICESRCKEVYETFGVFIDFEKSAGCKHFKNKADIAEVVRCGQCKWYLKCSMKCGHPFGLSSDRVMTTQFCSKGELKL